MKPINITEEIVSEICGHIRIGAALVTSLSACGFDSEQIAEIKTKLSLAIDDIYKDFAECIKKAESQFEIMQLMKINAEGGAGGVKWLLERSMPEKWGTQSQKAEQATGSTQESQQKMTFKEVVSYSGKSIRAIHYNINQQKLIQNPDKSFFRENVDIWLNKISRRISNQNESESLANGRKRLIQAQANRQELKLSIERGEYLRTDICMMLWGKMIQGCRAKLLSLPLKFSPLLVSLKTMNEIKDKLESGIYEALNELADMDLKALLNQTGIEQDSGSPNVGGDKKDLPTANKKKSKRMGRRGKTAKSGKQRGTRKMV